ncbi:dihydrolipoamide acetyltransferase family protein [Alkaliphilus crotonatoxidans]
MIEFRFPDIGEGITEGVLLKWLVQVGDQVKEGDSLCEVETDKVNAELPSPAAGTIQSLHGEVGETIYVEDILVVIDNGEGTASEAQPVSQSDTETKVEPVEEDNAGVVGALEVSNEVVPVSQEGRASDSPLSESRKKVLATPVARKMAHDLGINLENVIGTGPAGRIMKADIQKAHQAKAVHSPAPEMAPLGREAEGSKVERIKLSSLRRTISKKMTESFFTAPHTTVMEEIDVTELVEYRQSIKELFKEEKGLSITFLPFIIKATTLALAENPKFNGQLDEDGEHYLIKQMIDIGIAVDTEDGLLVPVIRDANHRGIVGLMEEIQRLGNGARERSLKIDELKGSSFTITNYGALGASFGTPIINYPEVAILGVGRIEKKPVVIDDQIVIRWILPLSLAIDHRVLDGGDAGRFIKSFKKYIQRPNILLLS